MSKKNKNKKKTSGFDLGKYEFSSIRDDEGFIVLQPTAAGKKSLSEITRRKSKVAGKAANTVTVEEPEGKEYDPTKMSEMLDMIEDFVRDGKYGKAVANADSVLMEEFIENFRKVDPESELGKKMYGMMRKLLSIGKSFYEYDDKDREILSNDTYDGLLSTYLASGMKEPVGIVPKGSKKLSKVAIKYPLLHNNMDKCYAVHEGDHIPDGVKESGTVEKFLTRVYKSLDLTPSTKLKLEISPKIDGVSVNGTIKGDLLVDPQTRGDEDESIAVTGMNGMPVTNGFEADSEFGIQYEAFVTDEDRAKASEYLKLEKPYVSNRHAAAGIIHRLSTMEDDNLLEFLSLYPIATEDLDGTYEERMDYIQNFGIVPDDMIKRRVIKGDMEDLIDEIGELYEKLAKKREKLDYSIDGMIITVLNDEYQETIGRDGRTNKFQIALKFDPATAEAVVEGIYLDRGKKGYRTIQVQFKHPVFLDGVRYDHVPVLSLNLFEQLKLREGSKVSVHRVGDVIPSISVLSDGCGAYCNVPSKCSYCGSELTVKNKKLYCANLLCHGNIVGRFVHFFEGIGLEGYSDSFAESLVTNLDCNNLVDVCNITEDDITKAGITTSTMVHFPTVLRNAISSKRDYEILGAMGLPDVGIARAKAMLRVCPMRELANQQMGKYREIANAAISKNNQLLIDILISSLFSDELNAINQIGYITTNNFDRIRVGHTGGALSDTVLSVCRANDFDVVDDKSFDLLITSSMGSTSGKMERAKKMGLPIYTEDSFLEQYLEPSTVADNESIINATTTCNAIDGRNIAKSKSSVNPSDVIVKKIFARIFS